MNKDFSKEYMTSNGECLELGGWWSDKKYTQV